MREKQLVQDKLTSKNEVDYIGKIVKRLLVATDFSNEQIIKVIERLVTIAKTIKETEDTTKNKELLTKLKDVETAIKERKNEVKILNTLDINEPSWIKQLKPKSNKEIERRLKDIEKAIKKIEIPEVRIPKKVEVKKPAWWNLKEVAEFTLKEIKNFIEEILGKKVFRVKTEKPIDVILTDKRGKAIDISALGGIATFGSSGIHDPLVEYVISDIDDTSDYYGFTKKNGSWYIMKVEEENVLYIKGDSEYADNWTNRANLNYDYFYLFTTNL